MADLHKGIKELQVRLRGARSTRCSCRVPGSALASPHCTLLQCCSRPWVAVRCYAASYKSHLHPASLKHLTTGQGDRGGEDCEGAGGEGLNHVKD